MSAKFLHAFADENPDLSRQIGCMTGIFQMFDKQYLLTNGRRLPAPPRRFPSGPTLSNSSSVSTDRISSSSPQIILEKKMSKSWKETQESSTSFSSSSSSFSSLDCNRSTNHDLPPVDRILFPEMPLKNSAKLKTSDSDIRDVVKDSINRTKEGKEREFYPKERGVNEIDEPFRVLSKLKEVSRGSIMESNQTPRFSFDSRDPFSRSLTRDGPRFSYDGREMNSSKSREINNYNNNSNSNSNNNNARLSLDSKEASLWDSDLDSSSSLNLNSNSNSITKKGEKIGIVAKLMGLDAMPKSDINSIESNKDDNFSKEKILINEKIIIPKSIKRQENRRIKNSDLGMKPISSSRIPIETAPWKSQERVSRISNSRETNSRILNVGKTEHVSVYNEIEKRLKDLEFEQSNRDLRALKQILDSMQAKGLLESKKEEPNSNSNPNFSQIRQNYRKNGTKTEFKSPIVIMKPAKSVTGTVETVPVPVLPQVRTTEAIITKKPPINTRVLKEPAGKASPRVSPNKRTQKSASNSNSNSNTTSPRLQNKSHEIRSKPPIPNSDSNKTTQRNKNISNSISPRNRARRKPSQTERYDDVASDVSVSRNGDEVSLRSDSNISMMSSKVDIEVTSADRSQNHKKEKVQLDCSNEINGSDPIPGKSAHLSPVSVLDNSFYHDDVSPPKSKSSNLLKDDKCQQSSEKNSPKSKKMENIENLLQKLNQLSLSSETDKTGPTKTTDYISLLCETANPDDRYISEILLASGLLMKDLQEIQLHVTGNPVNPDLFLVLEQRKSGWVSKTGLKPDPLRTERKLVFDLVNEILLNKMDLKRGGFMSGQKLLREICGEIKEVKREKKRGEGNENESEVLCGKDLVKGADEWARFERERKGLVLDIERGIFKELIDEVINGEKKVYGGFKSCNNNNNVKGKGRRRQLFVK